VTIIKEGRNFLKNKKKRNRKRLDGIWLFRDEEGDVWFWMNNEERKEREDGV
jgi:hypothetical protein